MEKVRKLGKTMQTEQTIIFRENISKTIDILKKIHSDSQLCLIDPDELANIEDLYKQLGYFKSEVPRIFLFGEFKSGKSTLVNALLKGKFAANDIFEMTSWIARYWKAEMNYCKIIYRNDEEKVIELEEFIEKTEKRRYDNNELAKIKRIDIGVSTTDVNFILIDTPGFGSINFNNEKKLLEFIYEADLILFIVDSESIGSIKEAATIKNYIKNEIPYLLVLNKTDLIEHDSELEEIINYLSNEYGAERKNIFPISAITPNDNGVFSLQNKLNDFATGFNSSQRIQAELGFLKIIAERLSQVLSELEKKIISINSKIEVFQNQIDSIKKLIEESLLYDLANVATSDILDAKKYLIVKDIDAELHQNDGSIENDKIMMILNKHFGDSFIDFLINKISSDIPVKLKEYWGKHFDDIKQKSMDISKELTFHEDRHTVKEIGAYNIDFNSITETEFKRGVKGSLGVAGVMTAYAAWFGPAAAAVTLPMAASGIGIPIAVIGAAISGLLAYNKRNKAKDKLNAFAEAIYTDVINKIISEITPEIGKNVTIINSRFISDLKTAHKDDLYSGLYDLINLNKIQSIKEQLVMNR